MKKRVLVLGYSQTGQLNRIVDSITAPLVASPDIEVVFQTIEPKTPFPYPWPFLTFFNNFPDTVYEIPVELKPLDIDFNDDFDLIILSYQVWFLSASRPVSSFLQLPGVETLFANKPVMTVIGCRNMWLMAQEKVKARLEQLGARLIDNVVLTDQVENFASLFSTPLWLLTGHKGPFLGGLVPRAGVSEQAIVDAGRFGRAAVRQLLQNHGQLGTMLQGLGAVEVNEKIIASEKIAHRSFKLWGRLLLSLGSQASPVRKGMIFVYFTFLVIMLLTVVPLNALIKRLLAPYTRERIEQQKTYFAAPSGEAVYVQESPRAEQAS